MSLVADGLALPFENIDFITLLSSFLLSPDAPFPLASDRQQGTISASGDGIVSSRSRSSDIQF